jgi:hypothetical protein
MQEERLADFDEFEMRVKRAEADASAQKASASSGVSMPLFRGQSNARWRLETTLERRYASATQLLSYASLADALRPQLESLTGQRWSEPELRELRDRIDLGGDLLLPSTIAQFLELWSYLRHHGFPSPLLDWTRSPYVASFFAFAEPSRDVGTVAVYVFQELSGAGKWAQGSQPLINTTGSTLRTHARHYQQQSEYTLCTFRADGNQLVFACHEDAFARSDADQDLLVKLVLQASERKRALKRLDLMNINAYTLFGTEDALLESMAVREFDLGKPRL